MTSLCSKCWTCKLPGSAWPLPAKSKSTKASAAPTRSKRARSAPMCCIPQDIPKVASVYISRRIVPEDHSIVASDRSRPARRYRRRSRPRSPHHHRRRTGEQSVPGEKVELLMVQHFRFSFNNPPFQAHGESPRRNHPWVQSGSARDAPPRGNRKNVPGALAPICFGGVRSSDLRPTRLPAREVPRTIPPPRPSVGKLGSEQPAAGQAPPDWPAHDQELASACSSAVRATSAPPTESAHSLTDTYRQSPPAVPPHLSIVPPVRSRPSTPLSSAAMLILLTAHSE